jgi:DNA polymerase
MNNHIPIQGDGNLDAHIMFIARNPSAKEVNNNIPLISKDGMLFQKYLDLFNFSRDRVYITNAAKCRTPSHRYPTDVELMHCRDLLENEIKNVNPKIIVLLGDTAMRSYFKLYYRNLSIHIKDLNGQYMIHNGRVIVFMIAPYHALNSIYVRYDIYRAFLTLLNLYRIINPAHCTNFNE